MGIVEEAHNVWVVGRGERTVVLAHGLGTDQSVWRHLVPHLVEEYRVVLFDNMGAGPMNPDYFDFERYATLEGYSLDLLAIFEELGINSCIYVGHSVSAVIGVIASISRPDLYSKIVMLTGFPRYHHLLDALPRRSLTPPPPLLALIAIIKQIHWYRRSKQMLEHHSTTIPFSPSSSSIPSSTVLPHHTKIRPPRKISFNCCFFITDKLPKDTYTTDSSGFGSGNHSPASPPYLI